VGPFGIILTVPHFYFLTFMEFSLAKNNKTWIKESGYIDGSLIQFSLACKFDGLW